MREGEEREEINVGLILIFCSKMFVKKITSFFLPKKKEGMCAYFTTLKVDIF